MTNKALILDLDDTIFPTRSIDGKIFEPFIDDLTKRLQMIFETTTIDKIINELWDKSIDYVIKKYKIDFEYVKDSFLLLNELEKKIDIRPFSDYEIIKKIQITKFLVTDGILGLQQAKIKSLLIESDYKEVIINDTITGNETKKDIFRGLIQKYNLIPDRTYVIGDNPESEIEAGRELNMITVQVMRNMENVSNADYIIKSFTELEQIIN